MPKLRRSAPAASDSSALARATGPTRRTFLQGAAVAAGATAVLPSWLAQAASASTPIGSDEGMLVVVQLSGGNDGLNTIVPRTGSVRSTYSTLRGALAIPTLSLLPLNSDWGFHPSLPKLASRYAAGKVAVVQGIGMDLADLSHFTSTATVSAGTAGDSRSTGWLGRYLDGTSTWSDPLSGIAVSTVAPLVLTGERAKICVAPATSGPLWGSDRASTYEKVMVDAIKAMADSPTGTGLGVWGDRLAEMNADGLDAAVPINTLRSQPLPTAPIARDLTLAARTLNSDFGTRVVTVSATGWDTHALQAATHASMLSQLDEGIEAFFATLLPSLANRVTMVVVSEFGRRAAVNGSLGTDHGRAGTAFVIGQNVKGGLIGEAPSLTSLDPNGDLVPTVDFRDLYATVLTGWLDADDQEVLGASYDTLDLFAAAPGASRAAA